MLDKRGGGYQDFPPKFFCLIVPNSFLSGATLFCSVSEISGREKCYG